MDRLTAILAPLRDVVHPGDVIDVLLVATLVYPAVVWVRRTQAGLVAIGLFILAGLYAAAQLLDLRLTTWLLQGFFAIILVVVVVIFQEEIRQLFERLALWSLRRGRTSVVIGRSPHEILVQCMADFARDRIGALVVLPGRQPIERHVHGGLELDGRISVPLLKSIFDPHSPGHDGAVILRDDRVTRFAGHLPLSVDLTQLTGVGTRHSAALGLAELTDALCLVVSEERGEISIARDGRLYRRLDPTELATALGDFTRSLAPAQNGRSFWRSALKEHQVEKLLTLIVVATLWWGLVPGARVVERTFEVPVRVVDLPTGMQLDAVKPARVEVTLSGPSRDFYLLVSRNLAVTVDGSVAALGRRTIRITDDDLRHPADLDVVRMDPETVQLVVRQSGPEKPEGE